MRHDHQIFTVFGGSFIGERRDAPPPAPKPNDHWLAPLAVLLIAALLGATIPAVAVTATKRIQAAEAARWKQPQQQPTYFLRVPATVGFDQAVF
jgi:hypothetical protein